MKKHIYLVLFLFLSSQAFAQLQDPAVPLFLWAESIDGPGIDHVRTVKSNNEGDLFILTSFRDRNNDPSISYKGVKFEGLKKDNNQLQEVFNFFFQKIKKDGTLIWGVHSTYGHSDINGCVVIPTNDEGALLLMKTFTSTSSSKVNKDSTLLCRIVDSNGKKTEIHYPSLEEKKGPKFFSPLQIKISKDGEVEWAKREDIWSQKKTINGKLRDRRDCITFFDGLTDETGNIYVTGLFRDTVYWTKPDSTKIKMIPNNCAEWTGSTQVTGERADLFVLKLNPKGEYLWHLNTKGPTAHTGLDAKKEEEIRYAKSRRIAYEAGFLYIAGTVAAFDEEKTVYLGDKSISVLGHTHLLFAKIAAEDGKVSWLKQLKGAYPFVDAPRRIKIESLSVSGNSLFNGGSFTGGIVLSSGDTLKVDSLTNGSKDLRGYALKLNASTGAYEASTGMDVGKAVGEVRDIYLKNDKVYSFDSGRHMTVLDQNMNVIKDYALIYGGDVYSAAFAGEDVFLLARAQNATIKFYGTETASVSTQNWGGIIASFKIPAIPSSVSTLSKTDNSLKLYTAKGQVIIDAEKATSITIYSISGQIVMRFIAEPGRTVKVIAPGVYIVNNKKVIVL